MRVSCTGLGSSELLATLVAGAGVWCANCGWWEGNLRVFGDNSRWSSPAPRSFFANCWGDSLVADGSSSMYVMSDRGRGGQGPVWLRELRKLCKLCKLCIERRSSRSSRVDLKALITRSCKHREAGYS